MHSIPHFPPDPSLSTSYSYPKSGCHFGQNLLCMNVDRSQLATVIEQLWYNEVNVYASNIKPNYLGIKYLYEVVHNKYPAYRSSCQRVTDVSGFKTFAKSRCFGDDLYSGLVAPTLASNLLVNTWQLEKKSDVLASNCTVKYSVKNVKGLKVNHDNFNNTSDHSKWAVSDDGSMGNAYYWTCIGDINRDRSQFRRGGGTVCRKSYALHKAYRQSITRIEKCTENIGTKKRVYCANNNTT